MSNKPLALIALLATLAANSVWSSTRPATTHSRPREEALSGYAWFIEEGPLRPIADTFGDVRSAITARAVRRLSESEAEPYVYFWIDDSGRQAWSAADVRSLVGFLRRHCTPDEPPSVRERERAYLNWSNDHWRVVRYLHVDGAPWNVHLSGFGEAIEADELLGGLEAVLEDLDGLMAQEPLLQP